MKRTTLTTIFCLSAGFAFSQQGAGAGDESNVSGINIVPSATVAYGRTDNTALRANALSVAPERDGGLSAPRTLEDGASDSYLKVGVDLAAGIGGAKASVNARSWFDSETFSDNSKLDSESYGITAGLNMHDERREVNGGVRVGFEHAVETAESNSQSIGISTETISADMLEDPSERLERDLISFASGLNVEVSEKTSVKLGYTYDGVNYGNESFFDSESHRLTGGVEVDVTEKTSVHAGASVRSVDSDAYRDPATGYSGIVGAALRSTDKLTYSMSLGVEVYDRSDAVADTGSRDTEDEMFSANGQVIWKATERMTAHLAVQSGYRTAAATANARKTYGVSTGIDFDLIAGIQAALGFAYRTDNALDTETIPDPASQTETFFIKEERTTYRYSGSLSKKFGPGFSLAASASYENGETNIPNSDFEESRMDLTAKISY